MSRPEDSSRRSSATHATLAAAGEARRAGRRRRRRRGVIAMMRVCRRCERLKSLYLSFCFPRKGDSSFERDSMQVLVAVPSYALVELDSHGTPLWI